MEQLITPTIWRDGSADKAAQLYADAFREGSVVERAPELATTRHRSLR